MTQRDRPPLSNAPWPARSRISQPWLAMAAGLAVGCAAFDPWGVERTLAAEPATPARRSARPAAAVAPVGGPQAARLVRPGETLSLAECVAVALERNPLTRAAYWSSRAAAARVGEERAAYLPSVTLNAGAERGDRLTSNGERPGARDDLAVWVAARQILFEGGARRARVDAAEAARLAEAERHNAAVGEVILAVALAYHERLAADALAGVAAETVKQTELHVELARARLQSGVSARFDVLKAETELADAHLGLVRARGASRVASGRLAQAMGLPVLDAPGIAPLPEEAPARALGEVKALLEEAAAERPELRAALAAAEARRAEVRAATARHLPTVSLAAQYGVRADAPARLGPDGREWAVGLELRLPLFEGFAAAYGRRRAQAEAERARAEHDLALRGVELEVWTAYVSVVEAAEAREASERLVATAEESARMAEGMYRAGVASIIELVDTQAARTAAHTRRVQARLDLASAWARLERTLGRTLAARGGRDEPGGAP